LLVGAILICGCQGFKVGGLPDWNGFSEDNHRPDRPIGGAVGWDFQDEKGRPHKVRIFGALTTPEVGPNGGFQLREGSLFFFGVWWTFEF
jgi:hypothetical protein